MGWGKQFSMFWRNQFMKFHSLEINRGYPIFLNLRKNAVTECFKKLFLNCRVKKTESKKMTLLPLTPTWPIYHKRSGIFQAGFKMGSCMTYWLQAWFLSAETLSDEDIQIVRLDHRVASTFEWLLLSISNSGKDLIFWSD